MTDSAIQILQFIKHFLSKNEELCIAGLGRFTSEKAEAVVDPVAKFIYPASRKIIFSQCEVETSPSFFTFLHQFAGISALEEKMQAFPKNLKEAIVPGRKLEIEGFGFFKYNVLGELDFEPFKTENFQPVSFGLKPVHFAANLLKVKKLEVVDDSEEEAEVNQMRESALKELKVMLDQAKIAESAKGHKSNKVFPIIATSLTLILLANLGFFLFKGTPNNPFESTEKSNMLGGAKQIIERVLTNESSRSADKLPTSTDSIAIQKPFHLEAFALAYAKDSFEFDSMLYMFPTDSQNLLLAAQMEPQIVSVANPKLNPEPILEAPEIVNADALENEVEAGFYVVAASFKNSNNSSNFVIDLRKQGYKEAVTLKPLKYHFHLASYARCKTLNRALEMADKLQAKGTKVWIYSAF